MKRQLLVEGRDDLVSVVALMQAEFGWPKDTKDAPFFIKNCEGVTKILNGDFLSAIFKERDLEILGILLDADINEAGRWQSVKYHCSKYFSDLPDVLPAHGLITTNEEGMRLGVWLMPDNVSPGSLETFLSYLVPANASSLWSHAVSSVEIAKTIGMPCEAAHEDKARLYSWLSWQNPPGQLCGRALTNKVLDPASSYAKPFVRWLEDLFELKREPRDNTPSELGGWA